MGEGSPVRVVPLTAQGCDDDGPPVGLNGLMLQGTGLRARDLCVPLGINDLLLVLQALLQQHLKKHTIS